jgi:hypothetical protein
MPLALGIVLYGAHNLRFQPWTLDDAYITFRYAENMAAGLGPVYNPGEHVEGYTTFLWMGMLSAASAMGLNLVWAAKVYGILASMLTLLLVSLSDRIVPGLPRKVAFYGGLMVATSPILTRWSMSGMEVPLVTLLITAGLLVHLRDRALPAASLGLCVGAGLLCALAAMSRPDAGLLFGVLGLDRLLAVARRRPGSLKGMLTFAAVFVTFFGSYFAWRYSYYGWLLPNTFYVKVGATSTQVLRGLYYINTWLIIGSAIGAALVAAIVPLRKRMSVPLAVASVAFLISNVAYVEHAGINTFPYIVGFGYTGLLLALLARARFTVQHGLLVGVAFASLHVAYVIFVGGDIMYGYRFVAVILPLMGLVMGAMSHSMVAKPWLKKLWFWLPLFLNLYWMAISIQLNAPGRVSERGIAVGMFFKEYAPTDAIVAVNVAGTIPYYSKLRAIDTLGLNDEHIAHMAVEDMGAGWAGHEKGDGAYVLSLQPDYVIFSSAHGDKRPRFRGDHDLFDSGDFQEAYDLHTYALESTAGEAFTLTIWVRREDHGGAGLSGATPRQVITGDLRASLPTREDRHNPTETWW